METADRGEMEPPCGTSSTSGNRTSKNLFFFKDFKKISHNFK